jgi:hemerythrin-like domain-containing protein
MPGPHVIDQLRDDHRLILRFLGALEHYADRLGSGHSAMRGAECAVGFIDEFIERFHHIREEHVLFRFLAEIGRSMDRQGAHLVHCHDEARDQLEGMRLATPPVGGERRTAFIWNALAFANLIREHIVREESWLYPNIEEILSPKEVVELDRRMLTQGPESVKLRTRALSLLEELERIGHGGGVCAGEEAR